LGQIDYPHTAETERMKKISLHILETPQEMAAAEELQRQIWPGTDRDAVPHHMLLAAAHNGGLVIGAIEIETPDSVQEQADSDNLEFLDRSNPPPQAELVGFVFGFLGMNTTEAGPHFKHCSHMLGVLPAYRDRGIGFLLKRAQWQMVRHQGLDLITWTYERCAQYRHPLRSLPGGLVGQFQARLTPDEQTPALPTGSGALPGSRDTDYQPNPR
jgi:GNAT superfamily N-acetyltransferase